MPRTRNIVGIVAFDYIHQVTIKVGGRSFQVPRGELAGGARNTYRLNDSTPITHVFPKKKKERRKPTRVKISEAFMKRLRAHPDY